jgi:hypothetical protein
MVEEESLNQLIERLQHLHLEQERILQALENIATNDDVAHVGPNTTSVLAAAAGPAPVPTVTAVQVPVPAVVTPVPTIFHI